MKGAVWGAPLLVSAVAILPFLPTLGGQFLNWDDGTNFLANPGFRGLGWAQLRWMATTTLLGHWVPLTWLSLGVNYALGGLDPWGYHLGNLLLHAASAAVLYVIAKRLLAAAWGAATPAPTILGGAVCAALLFAVHPLRVESVAWATERRDVLSGLFFLLAALGHLKAVEQGEGGRLDWRWRAASLGFFAAALYVLRRWWPGGWPRGCIRRSWRWAVSVDPECALCHNNLGSALALNAPSNPVAVAEAETHFRRAIALRPERDEYYNNLGGALALQGRLDESGAAFCEFLRRRPNVGSAASALGNIYVRQGRFSEAIPLLRRILRLDPSLDGARRDLALALDGEAEASRRWGNAAEAERLRQEAIEARAAMPTAKRPVEIPGRDRETARP